ncbi:MAG: hypothetical protein JWO46_352, partial [Nocardioidaceae bacterium]|nr:hypothetical protein [Nocardioidaceae bacterium]
GATAVMASSFGLILSMESNISSVEGKVKA